MRIRAGTLAAAVVFWSLPARAGDPAVAREQLKIGYTLAQEGKCDQALPHLQESLRLDPKPITLINLADCEEKVGKLTDAMGHWVDARARAKVEGLPPIEEEATARARALEKRLPRLTIVLAPSAPKDAQVERDGVLLGPPSIGIALPIDPGTHAIVVKAKGRPHATTEVQLAEGESKQIEVDAGAAAAAPAPPPPTGVRREPPSSFVLNPLALAGFGVAALGVGIGTVTGLRALDAGDAARAACPGLQCDRRALDDVETGRTYGSIATVSFVVAAAGAGLGVYALVRPRRDPKVGVSVGPASLSVHGRF